MQHYTGPSGSDVVGKAAVLQAVLPYLKAFSGLRFTEVFATSNDETGVGCVLFQAVGSFRARG